MTQRHAKALYCGIEYRYNTLPYVKNAEGAVTPAAIPHPMQTPCMTTPCGRVLEERWWPISSAAYGDILSTGMKARTRPFILPALRNHGDGDEETQRAIVHFNAVLCDFYSQKLLPVLYNYTGRSHSFHGKAGPIFVNAKQYHCILRRRVQRAKLHRDNQGWLVRKKYLHESRHKHATKRLRNAHGRFVSKVKTEEGIMTDASSSEPSSCATSS